MDQRAGNEVAELPGGLTADHELRPLDGSLLLGSRPLGSEHLCEGAGNKLSHPGPAGSRESQTCHMCFPSNMATFFTSHYVSGRDTMGRK